MNRAKKTWLTPKNLRRMEQIRFELAAIQRRLLRNIGRARTPARRAQLEAIRLAGWKGAQRP